MIYRVLGMIKRHPYAAALVGGDIVLFGTAAWLAEILVLVQREADVAVALQSPITAGRMLSPRIAVFGVAGVFTAIGTGLVIYGAHGLLKNLPRRSSR